jgi:hypothetical protein
MVTAGRTSSRAQPYKLALTCINVLRCPVGVRHYPDYRPRPDLGPNRRSMGPTRGSRSRPPGPHGRATEVFHARLALATRGKPIKPLHLEEVIPARPRAGPPARGAPGAYQAITPEASSDRLRSLTVTPEVVNSCAVDLDRPAIWQGAKRQAIVEALGQQAGWAGCGQGCGPLPGCGGATMPQPGPDWP